MAPSAGSLTIGSRRFVVPPWRHLLTMLGIGAAAITFVSLTQSGGNPVDAFCYWRIDPAHPYTTRREPVRLHARRGAGCSPRS